MTRKTERLDEHRSQVRTTSDPPSHVVSVARHGRTPA